MIDINDLGIDLDVLEDQTVASAGGGPREIPDEGRCHLVLITYVELGRFTSTFKDKRTGKEIVKEQDKVLLEWEVGGPRHPKENEETGRKTPFIIRETLTLSTNEKASYFKLFNRMRNGDNSIKHGAQLLGKKFLADIVHRKDKSDESKVWVNIKNEDGYTIKPPYIEKVDEETLEVTRVPAKIADPVTPYKLLILAAPKKQHWDSLFIDGHYDDRVDEKTGETIPGKSKNWIQERIMSAKNFPGSKLADLVGERGTASVQEELPVTTEKPSKPAPKESYDLNDDIPF